MIRLRHLLTATLLLFMAFAKAQEVTFSTPGGFYDNPFELTLSCDQRDKVIHYTTNGNTPTANDPVFGEPLLLGESLYSHSDIYTILNCPESMWFLPTSVQKCIVIRAAAFDENGSLSGKVTTNTYLIKSLGCDTHGLPAVSICADSLDLFDYERGIFVPGAHQDPSNPEGTGNYYQSGREWERPMNFEFYETDNKGVNQQAGLRTHGGNGRKLQQKCVKIYAREEYGKKRFKHPFFETIPDSSFKHLILKPFTSSWTQSGINDYVSNQIASRLDLETLASRPVALYLNGEYWGIYYIHERPDEHYLEDHCHVDINGINLIEDWEGTCEAGSNLNFLMLYDFIANNNLADPDAYSYVASQIDISNFIDYQIFEIFSANLDWPANNMRCWQEGNGPWRWIFFDGDIGLITKEYDAFANATYDGPSAYPASSTSTLFLRKLLENESFKVAFLNRFNQLLHSAFAYETTKPLKDKAFEKLEGEIPNQVARFHNPDSLQLWKQHMDGIDAFLSLRERHVVRQMQEYFYSDSYSFTIDALFPSPAQSEIHILTNFDKTTLTTIQIIDLKGRIRWSAEHVFGAGVFELVLPIHLPSGVYILRIGDTTRKFVVFD
ncbi:MAG: CotH kinase family protein [Bacteroidales bacterium]|nr:CotH kinase family protein [Bacteroidales bacterium]